MGGWGSSIKSSAATDMQCCRQEDDAAQQDCKYSSRGACVRGGRAAEWKFDRHGTGGAGASGAHRVGIEDMM